MLLTIETILGAIAGVIASLTAIFSFGKKFKAWLFKEQEEKQNARYEKQQKINKEIQLNTKRNEYLISVNLHPEKVEVIERLHDEYKELGCNSYITDLHTAWKEKYAKKIMEAKI